MIGKVIESIVAESMSYLVEEYELLPPNHFGGRPGRSTEDALMILSESIHQAWRYNKVFTVIFMDIAGAFNHVHYERLIHNMRQRRMPPIIIQWVQNFLKSRTTQLRFNGETHDAIEISAGIPQGSPISPILFMIYNADLVDTLKILGIDLALGFIDDVAYGVSGMTAELNAKALEPVLKTSEEWRKKHGAKFDPGKYTLIHFTRNYRKVRRDAKITLEDGTQIEPSEEGKYLGLIFDEKLKFNSNTSYRAKKGTRLALAMASVSRSTGGTTFPYVKRLYDAVVKPSTQYAAIVWHRPGDRKSPAQTQIKTLTTIQQRAMNAMLSTFRTTPTHLLHHESETIPVHLSLENQILKSLTRMQTTSPNHPIRMWIRRAQDYYTARRDTFPSNIEHLAKRYPQFCGLGDAPPLEEIRPYIVSPWWEKPYRISIAATKDKAEEDHLKAARANANNPDLLDIYTDGSGIEGNIGAAAYAPKIQAANHQYLGLDTTANVFTAELIAIKLAIGILDEKIHSPPNCSIYADSQADIKALEKPFRQSGQYILVKILAAIEDVKCRKSTDLLLDWVPGHRGIPGNEKADEEAKKAALQKQVNQDTNFEMRKLKSAQIMGINKRTAALAMEKPRNLRHVMTAPGCHKTGLHLYGELSRQQTATLARLRTAHCGLNDYLHRRTIVDDPGCPCGHPNETVQHYLLQCQTYKEPRTALAAKIGSRNMRVGKLLGDRRFIKHTLGFVEETGRFNN
jgi:ribonuclease HI